MNPSTTLRPLPTRRLRSLALLMCVAAACWSPPVQPAGATRTGVAWQEVESATDLDAAFERAKQHKRPLFLYWGARWCPPCNQVKARVFSRPDFIELSRGFVAVHLDGDQSGAQRLAERYQVRGYPTMVLFTPTGEELLRLPGEVDAPLYLNALRSALGGSAARAPSRPLRTVLADALAGTTLPPHEWRQLAWHAWDDGLPPDTRLALPEVLRRLALACPATLRGASTRLLLRAVAAAPPAADGAMALDEPLRQAAGMALARLLGDDGLAREHLDLVTGDVSALVQALAAPGSPQRRQLLRIWDQAAQRLLRDDSVSPADRLGALQARVDLAQLAAAPAPPAAGASAAPLDAALLTQVQALVAQVDRATTDPAERQAVVPTAAHLLADAGLLAPSDALLRANLGRVPAPHYLMGMLADNAAQRGETEVALRWSQQAWDNATGTATRLQWGVRHVRRLVELVPGEPGRIEAATDRLLGELGSTPDAYHERNRRQLQRLATALQRWAAVPERQPLLAAWAHRLQPVCAQQPARSAARSECERLLHAG